MRRNVIAFFFSFIIHTQTQLYTVFTHWKLAEFLAPIDDVESKKLWRPELEQKQIIDKNGENYQN